MEREQFDHIEQYILGNLSEDEQVKFEGLLESDESLRADYELVKLAIEGAKSKGLKEEFETIHEKLYPESKTKRRSNWIYLSMAASLALFVSFWFLLREDSVDYRQLSSEYFAPFPDYISTRNASPSDWEATFEDYSKANFEEFIKNAPASNYPEENENDILFYVGVSYVARENPSEAIRVFSDLLQKDDKYKQQIHWYMALAYLQNQEPEKAILLLRKIQLDEYAYSRAQQLLQKLSE